MNKSSEVEKKKLKREEKKNTKTKSNQNTPTQMSWNKYYYKKTNMSAPGVKIGKKDVNTRIVRNSVDGPLPLLVRSAI